MNGFDDIRAYTEADYREVSHRLWNDPDFLDIVEKARIAGPATQVRQLALSCPDLHTFHHRFVIPLLSDLVAFGTEELTGSGFEALDDSQGCLFLSNHRDIIMDTVQLNFLLARYGQVPSQTAVGNNLLIYPWINDFMRLSKSFVVKRNLSIKEQILASRELSAYISQSILDHHEPIWMAHREGRAKDGDDRTQKSVLKMLNLAGNGNVCAYFASIRLMPLSITYEFDPCDYLKATELLLQERLPDYRKTQADDLKFMLQGIRGHKGRVHYHVCTDFAAQLSELDETMHRNDLLQKIAERIDRAIHLGYKLFPNHYVAADRLDGSDTYADYYTPEQAQGFDDYIRRQLDKIQLPDSLMDRGELHRKMLEMYANPLKNQISASLQ